MGEEVRMSEYRTTTTANSGGGGEHEERVMEWEMGLPAADDLTPLSHQLIPPELASAFSISLNPSRTLLDVTRASETTLSNINLNATAANNFKSFTASADGGNNSNEPMVVEVEDGEEEAGDGDDSPGGDQDGSGSDTRNNKLRKLDSEEADSAARNLKRPRLVWTPQLHKRFVEVVAHLGIKNAVPKTIMQLMNVEGLTRENVASHLQKYRLYLKRMQGSSSEGGAAADPAAAASSSDHQLFASTPVPQSFNESSGNGNGNMGMPMQTMAYHQQQHHHHPMGMQMYGMHNPHSHHQYQNGFDHGNFNYGNGYAPHHNHHHHHPHHVGSNDNNVM